MLNLLRKITNLFVFQGSDKPAACSTSDFQVIVQKLTEQWFKDPNAVQDLDIIDTHWKSGKGTVECGNQFTVEWIRKMILKIEIRETELENSDKCHF